VVLNVAVTEVLAFRVNLHVPVPLQAPDHFSNLEPDFAVAVSVTDVPLVNLASHVFVQSMPVGLLVTVPAPLPAVFTVSSTGADAAVEALPAIAPAPLPAFRNAAWKLEAKLI
jgi:hypothetical protein